MMSKEVKTPGLSLLQVLPVALELLLLMPQLGLQLSDASLALGQVPLHAAHHRGQQLVMLY